jgi:tetratricopeptide (TPR) repeat protein
MKKSVMLMNGFLIVGLISSTSITVADSINPKDAWDYANRSNLKQAEGELDQSLADINTAIKKLPNVTWYYVQRGLLWKAKGRWDEALADANKAIEMRPDFYGTVYALRSEIWQAKGRWDEALADARKALELDPKSNEYVRRVYDEYPAHKKESEKKAKEEAAARKAREETQEYALTQASLWWSKGELNKAKVEFDKATEYNPQLLKFPLSHLKKPTFLNIGDTRRLVTDQEVFLVNDSTRKILYPYPDVAVELANLTEGENIKVVGECPKKGTLCSLNLRVVADLDLEHALLWENKLPPQSTQIQLQPSLSKVYTFTAEIPIEMASKPFELVLVSRKGRSFKYELQLQGTQLQVKQTAKGLANEL